MAETTEIVRIDLDRADHAADLGLPPPLEPTLFLEPATAPARARDPPAAPPGSQKLDFGVAFAVVIGAATRRVPVERALRRVAGRCIAEHGTERSWNERRSGRWTRSEGGDGFRPLGPWLVTVEEIDDPQNLAIRLDVDGSRGQDGGTRTMIFDVATIASCASDRMPLVPGGVVPTRTPPGVGQGRRPPFDLRSGTTVRASITGLGEMRQEVLAEPVGPRLGPARARATQSTQFNHRLKRPGQRLVGARLRPTPEKPPRKGLK